MKKIFTRFVYENAKKLWNACLEFQKKYEEIIFEQGDSNTLNEEACINFVFTDDPQTASLCEERKIPCLVLLHEQNQWVSFPCGAYCIEQIEDITPACIDRITQRVNGQPWTILETQRLLVREITEADVPRLYELYRDPEITEYMEDLFENPAEEVAYTRHYIENIYAFYGYGMWIVIEKETGEIIGRAGLENKEGFDGLELGFMIGKNYQRQGYAFEVCQAIIAYAEEELEIQDICALVREENKASIALCHKLGFVAKGKRSVSEMNHEGRMCQQQYLEMQRIK